LRLRDADAADEDDRRDPSDCLTSHDFRLQNSREKKPPLRFQNALPPFRRQSRS
jgi:hypothetical protein